MGQEFAKLNGERTSMPDVDYGCRLREESREIKAKYPDVYPVAEPSEEPVVSGIASNHCP